MGAQFRIIIPRQKGIFKNVQYKCNMKNITRLWIVDCVRHCATWHSLLQYHRLEQPAHTNSDFFMPQPLQSGVFFTSAAAGASAPPLPEQRQLSEGS